MDRKNIITPNQTIHILLAMKKKFIKFNTSVYGNMPRYIKLNLVQNLLEEAKEKKIFCRSLKNIFSIIHEAASPLGLHRLYSYNI